MSTHKSLADYAAAAKAKGKSRRPNISLSQDTYDALQALSAEFNMPMATVIGNLIDAHQHNAEQR